MAREESRSYTFVVGAAALIFLGAGAFLGVGRDPPPTSPATATTPAAAPTTSEPEEPEEWAPAAEDVELLGELDRKDLRSFRATPDGALAQVGPRLLRFAAGSAAPGVVAGDVLSSRLHLRDGKLFFLAGSPEAPALAVLADPGGVPTRTPLTGSRARDLLHVYEDGRTLVIREPTGPALHRTGVGPLGRLPRPEDCTEPELVGVLPRSQAVLRCPDGWHLADFFTPLPHTVPLSRLPAGARRLEAPGHEAVGPERYLWPLLALGDSGETPGIHRVLPARGRLPEPARVRDVLPVAGADLLVTSVERKDHSRTLEVLGRDMLHPVAIYARGEFTPPAAHLSAHGWLVWWEAPYLVVVNTRRAHLLLRMKLEGDVAVIPGAYWGDALPLDRRMPGVHALNWLVRSAEGLPTLVGGSLSLGGRPVLGGSVAGAAGVSLLYADGRVARVAGPSGP